MKHETLRLIIEKTGQVDEAQLRELLNPTIPPLPANHPWMRPAPPGDRMLRVFGTIVMFGAVGFALFSLIIAVADPPVDFDGIVGLGIAVLIGMVGAGLFFSSRFVTPPPEVEPRDR
jgi:hypothetical protein